MVRFVEVPLVRREVAEQIAGQKMARIEFHFLSKMRPNFRSGAPPVCLQQSQPPEVMRSRCSRIHLQCGSKFGLGFQRQPLLLIRPADENPGPAMISSERQQL